MTSIRPNLKYLAFGLAGAIIPVLMAATVTEKVCGTASASQWFYGSAWFSLLWGITAVAALAYVWRTRLYRQRATFMLHLAFLLILSGAFITHVWGIQGRIHLRQDRPTRDYLTDGQHIRQLPFTLTLQAFRLEYYAGTFAPKDYISSLHIRDKEQTFTAEASMNHICTYRHYRFYQAGYDADEEGCTLVIAHDPYGIGVTYTGYGLLLTAILQFFFERNSRFRQLLRHPLLRKGGMLAVVLTALCSSAQAAPATVSKTSAERLGNLYVYHNDRICPLQTLAIEFTRKIYGKDNYRGLTAEQVLAGWLLHYDEWAAEPMIRIKSPEVRRLLGIRGEYASLKAYIGPEGYKLEKALQTESVCRDYRGVEEANEKYHLITLLHRGSLLRIYPYRSNGESQPVWYALTDRLPTTIPNDRRSLIRTCLNCMSRQAAGDKERLISWLAEEFRKLQEKEAEGFLPTPERFGAEKLYNKVNCTQPVALACITLGVLTFLMLCIPSGRRVYRRAGTQTLLTCTMTLLLIYLLLLSGIRGFVSGHLPLSNGLETMQFMAICTATLTLLFHRRYESLLSFGFLIGGLALLVATLGESDPPITPLMPVLTSPLLSVHVASIMMAYSLLALIMLNGLSAITLRLTGKENGPEIERLQLISRILLYPALFLLTAGIFIGAVWANVSWGRYWGWDPKETWALITLLIYAAPLHSDSLPWFRKPLHFHLYMIIAFVSVLVTYFGVNFLLGGMHSYA